MKEATVRNIAIAVVTILLAHAAFAANSSPELRLTPQNALEAHGLSIFLFHNSYHPVFGDQKMSGLEIIFHERRIATNGDVRLSATPAQWDPIPQFKERKQGPLPDQLMASLSYADRGFQYQIAVRPEAGGMRVSVLLDNPLPSALSGKAGFNLEFLPPAFFGKSYLLDDAPGMFPRHPGGPMIKAAGDIVEPAALASGHSIVLSPEDPVTRVAIRSETTPLMLFDGRNQAPNGWFVVRSLLPAEKSGEVIVWHIQLKVVPGWTRLPVIGHNQIGYTPERSKVAVIELDPEFQAAKTARVLRLSQDGSYKEVFRADVKPWGQWLRYRYAHFDFSTVRDPGIYAIEYAGQVTAPFPIAKGVYAGIWHTTLDTFLAEQMDHVKVREGYRIWHGASHLDDARQAPVNYTHFDGYSQGATTDSPFAPGAHIPGINVGGWYDARDFDLRTQTHTRVITDLAVARETFGLDWDGTTVDEDARYVQISKPDGVPDAIQQIIHGVRFLLAQYQVFGHAIPGVIEPTLEEYTHLGDAASKTDGKIYSEKISTTQSADECLRVAENAWEEEHKHEPVIFRSFNTAGGDLAVEETKAAIELVIATQGREIYQKRLMGLLPTIHDRFMLVGGAASRAIPYMNSEFKAALRPMVVSYKKSLDENLAKNPYGVPIAMGTWGGSNQAAGFASQMYFLHRAFPDIVGAEYTFRGLDYVLGVHPVSDVSYVSGIGAQSKLIAYGNNRADYTFIPGGMIPGVTVVQPDFPELTNDWPFLWYENEYVVDTATAFILAANCANDIGNEAAGKP